MTRGGAARGAGAAVVLALAVSGASGEACPPGLPGGVTLETPRYVVGYRTTPASIVVGEHFSVDLTVCARGDAPAPESVRVDAHMPEHRHGMNYRAAVTGGAGRYRADGLMFHMPGRWEFVFEVRAAGQTDRLTPSVELE